MLSAPTLAVSVASLTSNQHSLQVAGNATVDREPGHIPEQTGRLLFPPGSVLLLWLAVLGALLFGCLVKASSVSPEGDFM